MAITINYLTYEILIPKADTTFLGTDPINGRELRQMDMDDLWTALADIQDNQADVWAPTAYINTPPQDLGSFVLGRSVLIQAPYFVTFEDGLYAVNFVGGNTNLASRTTINSVQIITNNSAGLVQVTSGSGVTEQDKLDIADRVWDETKAQHTDSGSTGEQLNLGALTAEQADQLRRVWQALMLDPASPVLTTDGSITFDDVVVTLTGDSEIAITGTRQP